MLTLVLIEYLDLTFSSTYPGSTVDISGNELTLDTDWALSTFSPTPLRDNWNLTLVPVCLTAVVSLVFRMLEDNDRPITSVNRNRISVATTGEAWG